MFEVTCISYQSRTITLNLVVPLYFMHEHRTRNSSGLLVGILYGWTDQLGCIIFHNFMTQFNFIDEASVAQDIHNKRHDKGFYYLTLICCRIFHINLLNMSCRLKRVDSLSYPSHWLPFHLLHQSPLMQRIQLEKSRSLKLQKLDWAHQQL